MSPSSGTWCDRHYRQLVWLHPMGWYGHRVYAVAIICVVAAYLVWQH